MKGLNLFANSEAAPSSVAVNEKRRHYDFVFAAVKIGTDDILFMLELGTVVNVLILYLK